MHVAALEIGASEELERSRTGLIGYYEPEVFILWTSFLNIAWSQRLGLVQGGAAYVTTSEVSNIDPSLEAYVSLGMRS